MSRIFVTGATGACGPYVVRELLARGHELTVLTRSPMTRIEGCTTVSSDLYSVKNAIRQIRRCDAMVHMAATRNEQRREVITQDILGTGELLDLWNEGPFVYASSQAVYGDAQTPFEEFSPMLPSSWYGMAKYAGEFQLQEAARRTGLPAIALRFAPVLTDERGQLLERIYVDARRDGRFVFDSEDGLQTYGTSYTGPQDYATAVALALDLERSGSYNVASGYVTWNELIAALVHGTGSNATTIVREPSDLAPTESRMPQRCARLDTNRFVTATGFAPADDWTHIVDAFLERKTGAVPT